LRPALIDVLDTLHHRVSGIAVEEMLVKPGMAAVGKTIAEAGLLNQDAAKVLAVQRHDGAVIINPDAKLRLEDGDLLVALGSEDQLYATAAMLK
jgi:K+/H+ antiporter YhaU regulatory subunit KhtT